jgi:SAM-dependent methyltransferase
MAERERRRLWEERHARGEALARPSPFVSEWARRLRDAEKRQRALDVACGGGRHVAELVAAGFAPVALDASRSAVKRSIAIGPVSGVVADAGALPLRRGSFDLVVMTCFLDRAIIPDLAALLVPGGHLLIETFRLAQHQLTGHPRREFCLEDGELERLCGASVPALAVVAAHQRLPGRAGDPPALAGVVARRG